MSQPLELSIDARISALGVAERRRLLDRTADPDPEVRDTVSRLIEDVAERGDIAIRDAARRFEGVELGEIEIDRRYTRRSLEAATADLVAALGEARAAIDAFHRQQLPVAHDLETHPGVRVGRRPEPLRRVGAYAPGGRAVYPSSVLMCVVPAKVAGVEEVVVCSPPTANGRPAAAVLAACEIAGADRVFAIGGATAVAALALGTESVPRVAKVVGPGNKYVSEAKRQLAGAIAADCFAGPSELLVIADDSADPGLVARELMAQAEHDPDAVAVVVAIGSACADAIRAACAATIGAQPRRDVIREALAARGAILVADRLHDALRFANRFAPEHLLMLVHEPRAAFEQIRCAGAAFLGPYSSVAFGDYISGANHVLPTGGQARSSSGLATADFMRWCSVQEVDANGAASLAGPAALLADAEGLPAHADAMRAFSTPRAADRPATATQGSPRRPVRMRPEYASLSTYDPGRAPCAIDLSDNTNLFGQAPSASRALAALDPSATRRYPSVYAEAVKAAAADYFGVPTAAVTTGAGSDDLIDSTIRAFCAPSQLVTFPEPTFSMIESFATMNGCRPLGVPLREDFRLDVRSLVAARGALTYICRPNNPTGTLFERRSVEAVADAAEGIVVIDEAYGDFCDDPLVGWASETERVVVLRTLSKAFGLAGLRVGLAIGPPALIAEIEKSRGPYKVGVAAEAAAAAALRDDREWILETVEQARRNRQRLAEELARLGIATWPSAANFLLMAAPGGDARALAATLADDDIGVRPFPRLPRAGDCVRVTIGPWPLMERFLSSIESAARR